MTELCSTATSGILLPMKLRHSLVREEVHWPSRGSPAPLEVSGQAVRYPDNPFVPITRQACTSAPVSAGTTQRTAATESNVTALNGNLITAASSFFIRAGSFL